MASEKIIIERSSTHGVFKDSAVFVQMVKAHMRKCPKWGELTWTQQEALDMVIHKMGRILHGDPLFFDHWVDAQNYLKLVTDEMRALECSNTST